MHFGRACCSFPTTGSSTHPTPPPHSTFRQPFGVGEFAALKQACSTEYHGAQGAFKDSMIHGILQFTLPIAFRCVLHRWENQEIRCRKLYKVCWPVTVQRLQRTYNHTSLFECVRSPIQAKATQVHTGLWMYSGLGARDACASVWQALQIH